MILELQSIVRAHENLQSGRIFVGETEVKNASRNRSPTSYLLNPEEERALLVFSHCFTVLSHIHHGFFFYYVRYEGHTDTTLIQMRFVNANDKVIGAIHWFATHSVSMNNSNLLISSDNVGYAAILLEQEMNPNYRPGKVKILFPHPDTTSFTSAPFYCRVHSLPVLHCQHSVTHHRIPTIQSVNLADEFAIFYRHHVLRKRDSASHQDRVEINLKVRK